MRKNLQACNFPPQDLNILQKEFNCKHNIHNGQTSPGNQLNNNNSRSNNNKNISIVIPYIQEPGERFKRTCNSLGVKMHFKGTKTIKLFSWPQRTGTSNFKRVESYIDLNVHTSTVWKNVEGDLAEHLGTCSRKTLWPHPYIPP